MDQKFSIIIFTVSLITLKFPGKITAENNLKISIKDSALGFNNQPSNYVFETRVFYTDCKSNPKFSGYKECTDNNSCKSLKYSECSDGSCKCLPGYIKSIDKCLASFGSKCSSDSECTGLSNVCLSGTCQCPKTYYSVNGSCHEYAEWPGYPAYSAEACQHSKNLMFSGDKCICEPSYVEMGLNCRSKLGSKCTEDLDCVIEGSICSSGICRCNSDYHEHGGSCYGFPAAECNIELNCITTSNMCQFEICQVLTGKYEDNQGCDTNNPGIECWKRVQRIINLNDKFIGTQSDSGSPLVCRGTYLGITLPGDVRQDNNYHFICNIPVSVESSGLTDFHILESDISMVWKSYNYYDLALAVLGSIVNDKPSLICRSKAQNGVYYVGAVKPPYYNKCHYHNGNSVIASGPENYQVLQYSNYRINN